MDEAVRRRLERVLDDYFDVRTVVLVERVIGTASASQIEDADAMDRLFREFVALLEERYDRGDPGWRGSAETFLAAEWDRQVDAARSFYRSFDER